MCHSVRELVARQGIKKGSKLNSRSLFYGFLLWIYWLRFAGDKNISTSHLSGLPRLLLG
jgi:hypothetical protein